ncbi:HK97 gp10 family phage protein [Listeria monocytogenes]|nr:HK97 gp10 family phage protein [Listeria monocytogenes]EFV4485819.1 HK97 gp10 family phage protein [Listeria monocytogenes]HDU7246308.1 HK97 gp10 family phage protein [Listeria monocytogenes]
MSFSSFKDAVIDDIHNKTLSTAAKAGQELVELAEPVTPILYGDLRRSSHAKVIIQKNSTVARVFSLTPYARRQYYENRRNPRWYEMAISYGIQSINQIVEGGMKL